MLDPGGRLAAIPPYPLNFGPRCARLAAALVLCVTLLGQAPVRPYSVHAQETGRFYVQTGQRLAPEFVSYFDANGGVPTFGYPVTDAHVEGAYLVQWTERERLEYHPENLGTRYEVLLGLLGRELTRGLDGPRFARSSNASAVNETSFNTPSSRLSSTAETYFPETGQVITDPFLSYWRNNGGLPVFGYPVSDIFTDDGGLQVQWFERARFEYHPENRAPYDILLGHLGLEALRSKDVSSYTFDIGDTAVPDSRLKVDVAQGGESDDPDFFSNIRDAGAGLGPGLVRLDNIFTAYNVVQRAADGTLRFRWDDLDKVIDGIRAMGREPLLCLSYMPEALSSSGKSRVVPPAHYEEWAALVRATVLHMNVERKLGLRYWEVWNEPNQWSFWQSSFQEYLKLYDTTVEAATGADPSVRIGGPGLSLFSNDHLAVLFQHEAGLGKKGRIDFISWHSYGRSATEIAEQIRSARSTAGLFPQFKPELFITEFNVLQGGPGDISANSATDTVEGAISLLSSIESMQREQLDRAFLFELKDGEGPSPYWGRWGILTNDGQPKPIYHALKAYLARPPGMLPVSMRDGPTDGTVGLMAFGGPQRASLMLWYTGAQPARVKLTLPATFATLDFDITLFDKNHNNPARSGDSPVKTWMSRNAGDLALDLLPNSLVLLQSR